MQTARSTITSLLLGTEHTGRIKLLSARPKVQLFTVSKEKLTLLLPSEHSRWWSYIKSIAAVELLNYVPFHLNSTAR